MSWEIKPGQTLAERWKNRYKAEKWRQRWNDSVRREQNRKNASLSRKKTWAIDLAKSLANKKFSDAWVIIPESDDALIIDKYEIYRDGNTLCAKNDETGITETIGKESFRTGYFVKKLK